MKQPDEEMTADEMKTATSSASYDRIQTMLNDAIAVIKIDDAYAELTERLSGYDVREYHIKKKIVETLRTRQERCKKPSKKPRKKPFTIEDSKTLTAFEIYVSEYEYLQTAIDRNRMNRDSNNGHANTAVDLLQTAYLETYNYIGHAPDDECVTTVYKNGNTKTHTVLQMVRNAIQNAIRHEERTRAKTQSYEELTRYNEIKDSETGEIIGYEEIEPLYIDSMYAIEDYETYSSIMSNIDKIGMSAQQERIIKWRLRGYSLAQIADIETDSKIKTECINAIMTHGHTDRAEAKKRYAKLAETMTAFEIQSLMIEYGYIDESKKAKPTEKSDIHKQLRRVQQKYIEVFGVPSNVDMMRATK